MGVEVVVVSLLLAAVFVAVPLATLVHIESATVRAARHVDTFADLSQSRFETAPAPASHQRVHICSGPAGNGAATHLRLVHIADDISACGAERPASAQRAPASLEQASTSA
jgi:hypothetical protein